MSTPWKLLFDSVAGTSHQRRGEPCQDYSHGLVVAVGESSSLILACADGAGSAAHAEIGARLACLALVCRAAEALRNGLTVPEIGERHMRDWYDFARRRLSLEACIHDRDPRDYACTLLTAVVGDAGAVFAQVGDGAIVYRTDGGYETATWPQSGEYVNTTFFLTGHDLDERLIVRSIAERVDEVALFTDGLQPLALHYASRTVHAPFFEPLFGSLHKYEHPEVLEEPLRTFLKSGSVIERIDDDKTLLLATRHSTFNEGA
jgi:hypothetical protein